MRDGSSLHETWRVGMSGGSLAYYISLVNLRKHDTMYDAKRPGSLAGDIPQIWNVALFIVFAQISASSFSSN